MTSVWKLWVFVKCICETCAVCERTSWRHASMDKTDARPDHLTTMTSYLHTLILTLRGWVVFSCLSKEDDDALQHDAVLIISGLDSWRTTKELGYILRLWIPSGSRQSSHNACVLNITVRCSHYLIYTRIYLCKKNSKPPTSTHTTNTPESLRTHNFGMAVGSMQTWNLSLIYHRCRIWGDQTSVFIGRLPTLPSIISPLSLTGAALPIPASPSHL